ncbi:hypothetical protein [Streptomyces canus]|uniref:hypothetical protein n=1 Tax=Streptomyces canus TaxID=58343 RepID=UPI00278B7E63|nr:hypothetical protein [Streptomyces canus]MDQ1068346.1 hypothetical protein [Streptomyces canus]
MAADWWARGIAIGAGTATGLNMLVAFRTYLRVKPRVRLRVTYGPLKLAFRNGFLVRIRNISPTSTKIDEVSFTGRYAFPKKARFIRRSRYVQIHHRAVFVSSDDLESENAEAEMELPGFGGVRWELEPYSGAEFGNLRAYRLEVTLTNGECVKSEWVTVDTMKIADDRMRPLLDKYRRRLGGEGD